jgi:hypothetical protein
MDTLPNEMPIYLTHDRTSIKRLKRWKKINDLRTLLIGLLMTVATPAPAVEFSINVGN